MRISIVASALRARQVWAVPRLAILAWLGCLVVLSGCSVCSLLEKTRWGHKPDPGGDDRIVPEVREAKAEWQRSLQQACSSRHLVAISTERKPADPDDPRGAYRCPGVAGWKENPLFADSFRPEQPMFCRYAWEGAERPSAEALAALQSQPSLHGAVQSCAVVAPLRDDSATPNPWGHEEMFYRELRYQVGVTDLPRRPDNLPEVRLVVVDGEPTGEGVADLPCAGCSQHGFSLAHIARNLICGPKEAYEPYCAARLATRLALPLRTVGDQPVLAVGPQGGLYGRPSDVAKAIADEVGAKRDPKSRWVLNLSLGWDPELLHGNLPGLGRDQVNAEELSVYAALAYARENNVPVIAASGNSPGGSIPGGGATLPARWYRSPPTLRETGGLVRSAEEPVLYAIGAVDRNDRPLFNVRTRSLPPLVAYGDHAMVPLPGGGWTEPMTGTSVSSLVASSIAAVAWSLRPDLDADGILDLLVRSGSELPFRAELYRSQDVRGVGSVGSSRLAAAPFVRRLRFAAALSRAWSTPTLKLQVAPLAQVAGRKIDCGQTRPLLLSRCGAPMRVRVCEEDPAATPAGLLAGIRCPSIAFPSTGSVPWVLQQPEQPPCPSCSLASGPPPWNASLWLGRSRPTALADEVPAGPKKDRWTLYLQVPPSWGATSSGCLTDLLLEVTPPGGETERLWIVPAVGTVCSTETLAVTGLPFDPAEGTSSLTFHIEKSPYSIRSPIFMGWER